MAICIHIILKDQIIIIVINFNSIIEVSTLKSGLKDQSFIFRGS